jgi:hypothetical protein
VLSTYTQIADRLILKLGAIIKYQIPPFFKKSCGPLHPKNWISQMEDQRAFGAGFFSQEGPPIVIAPRELPWWERFKDMDRYDWNDPGFLKRNRGKDAFLPIPLSHAFFMIVPKWKYKRMLKYPDGKAKKWAAKIDYNKDTGEIVKVYGRRCGRVKYDEPHDVYASREIMGVLYGRGDVDHVNGWSLDNRCRDKKGGFNLDYVSTRRNGSNCMQTRRVNTGLKRGVEPKGFNPEGKPRYGGIYAIRLGKNRVKTVRTKKRWLTQEPAHRWYLNQLKRRYGRTSWAFIPTSVTYPVFPPLMESESVHKPALRSKRTRMHDESLMATF